MNKTSIGSIIALCVPLACAIIAAMMCYSQLKQRDMARQDQALQQQNVDTLTQRLKMVSIEPLDDKHLAFEDTPEEQAQFLTQLRMNAQNSGVKLVQYTNMGRVLTPQNANRPNEPAPTYKPVASTLTVQGPYDGVRAFAYSVLRSNRLMNMSGVTWKRDTDGKNTNLSFTLIRYVTNPGAPATTTAAMAYTGSVGGAIR